MFDCVCPLSSFPYHLQMLVENETIDKMPDETMFQSKHGLVNGGGGVCVCLCSFYRYVFISAIVQLLSHSSVPKIDL